MDSREPVCYLNKFGTELIVNNNQSQSAWIVNFFVWIKITRGYKIKNE